MATFIRKVRVGICSLALATTMFAGVGAAVEPDEILKDPALETRARELSLELRCLVCQNQSIDDSNAPLARDLRLLVRDRLKAGDTNREVLDFVVARYGQFVLLKPPFNTHTLLLWLAPALALISGIWLAYRVFLSSRGRDAAAQTISAAQSLTPDEEAELRKILDEK
ncbi:cytochrome c-type biogenesis protein CcmH [Filomicrobium insigne]|uniref:Cytochrome c-type biogenesis protein n=1 Tax=Filomicrobium insigne TaxID=418854 RepID=A0A1H0SWS3_9HYPH|nr:cytochrome c-type biogenesis protein CcmH [Filomicrobium insigne]